MIKMNYKIWRLVLSVFLILSFTSCNNNGKEAVLLKSVNDSLSRQISQISDTMRQVNVNKKLVADFYQELFGDKDISAIDKYIGDTYIQHNPGLKDGKITDHWDVIQELPEHSANSHPMF